MTILFGGHRGSGCTDHAFYAFRNPADLPAENTAASVQAALAAGADFIEVDVVLSADSMPFCLHNVVPSDHFFVPPLPARRLSELPFRDIAMCRTGRAGQGQVTRLSDMLALIAVHDRGTGPYALNIELKGVQGSVQAWDGATLLPEIARVVRESPLDPSRILFSSFAHLNVAQMTRLLPRARYALLFSENPAPRPIYADRADDPGAQYMPFTLDKLARASAYFKTHAAPGTQLYAAHPEVTTVTSEMVREAARSGLALTTWALFEKPDGPRGALYRDLAAQTAAVGLEFAIITDYLAWIRPILQKESS